MSGAVSPNTAAARAMADAEELLSTFRKPAPAFSADGGLPESSPRERLTAARERQDTVVDDRLLSSHRSPDKRRVDTLFDMLDADGDGSITPAELREVLTREDGGGTAGALLQEMAQEISAKAGQKLALAPAPASADFGDRPLALSPARSPARSPVRSPARSTLSRSTSSSTARPHQMGTWGSTPSSMGHGGSRTTSHIKSGRDGHDRASGGRYYSMLLASASPSRYSRQAGAAVKSTEPYQSPIRNLPKIEMRDTETRDAALRAAAQEAAAEAEAEAAALEVKAAEAAQAVMDARASGTASVDGEREGEGDSAAERRLLEREAQLASREAELARKEAEVAKRAQFQRRDSTATALSEAPTAGGATPPRSAAGYDPFLRAPDSFEGGSQRSIDPPPPSMLADAAPRDSSVTPMTQYHQDQAANKAAAAERQRERKLLERQAAASEPSGSRRGSTAGSAAGSTRASPMQQYQEGQTARKAAAIAYDRQELAAQREAREREREPLAGPDRSTSRSRTEEGSPSGAVAGWRTASSGEAARGLEGRRANALADTHARLFPAKGSRWSDDTAYVDMKARFAKNRAAMVESHEETSFVITSAGASGATPRNSGYLVNVVSPRGATGSGRLASATPSSPIVSLMPR